MTPALPLQERDDPRKRRLLKFLESHADSKLTGIEIGPYDRPILTRPEWDVLYADVLTTDEVKKRAALNSLRNIENVVDIDLVLADQSLAEKMRGCAVDFIFGSHVYEHIPNLLGFLRDVAAELGSGGRIIGAFPDRRYTFDIDRPRTTMGQLLDRDVRKLTRPCAATVFDHFFHFRSVKAGAVWNYGTDHGAPRNHTLERALTQMEKSSESYIDAHVNLFSDAEFEETITVMAHLGIPLAMEALAPTVRPFNEFFFCLKVIG